MIISSPTITRIHSPDIPVEYSKRYPNAKYVWHDSEFDEYFSKHQTVLRPLNENFAFFDEKESWLDGAHGTMRFRGQCEGKEEGGNRCWSNGLDVLVNDEIFYSDHPQLQLHGKSVLVVGAGPTTIDHDWEKAVEDFGIDEVWSMNYFYTNSRVANHPKLSLVTLGNEVDFTDERLISHLDTNGDILIYQEPCFVKKDYHTFTERYSKRVGWFHTRYTSKLGTAPRLVLLAILAGASHVYVVGFDGYTWDAQTAFARADRIDTKNREGFNIRIWKTGVILFWEYVKELQSVYPFKVTNLGHGHPKNVSSIIPFISPALSR